MCRRQNVKEFDPAEYIRGCVSIIHEGEWNVHGRAYNAMVSIPVEKTQILKHKQRELVDKATEEVAFADKVMWSGIRRKHPALPRGCKTLLLELFCGAMVMTAVAATHPLSRLYPVSQPTDYILDELDMTNPDHRTIIDRQIDEDDPYLTTIAFNCGPWNPLTRF